MTTLLLIFIPLVSGVLMLFLKHPRMIRNASFLLSLVGLAFTVYIAAGMDPSAGMQHVFRGTWLPQAGIDWNFSLDGISMLMVLLTNLLVPFIIFCGSGNEQNRPGLLHFLIFLAQSALAGVFTSFNAMLFYIFWELALIPVFFILFLWGGERRQSVTMKFFIYTLFGSLFMLIVFIWLFHQTPGPHSFDYTKLTSLKLDDPYASWAFFLLLLAFFIKIPLFPGHSWQPDTYTTAPYQGTMLLAGLMMKMGVYGMIRWMLPIMPAYVAHYGQFLVFLPLAGLVYASFIALKQQNLKTLIAFSSMAHAGLMGAAVFGSNLLTIQGVLFQSFAHGILIVALFYFAMLLEERTGTLNLSRMGGIRQQAPLFSGLLLVAVLGSVGLPLTNGFVGEFLMIFGLWDFLPLAAVVGGATIVMSAIYMLYAYQQAVLGPENPVTAAFRELNAREMAMLIPLILLVLISGIWPQLLLRLTEAPARELLNLTSLF